MTPTHITIHNTANEGHGADARAHARYLARATQVSWHYTVDDERVVETLPIGEIGWHAGSRPGNARSIGVEICMHAGIDQDRAFARAARLAAVLLYDLELGVDRVVTHHHWSGKRCPVLLLEADGTPGPRWASFLQQVQEIIDAVPHDDANPRRVDG